MGALHQGHLSLVERSLKENQISIISIFVNPTQFTNASDLENYPKTLDTDIEKVKGLSKDVVIFAPSVEDMYEGNTVSSPYQFDGLENQMEGEHRPGHFDGVGTVVKLLLDITEPTNSYWGEKDFQQLQIVKKLVEKCKMPKNVIGCPIYREENGLAMSSRNERLSEKERKDASLIYETLESVREKFKTETPKEIGSWVQQVFAKNPDFEFEYFQIADEERLLPIANREDKQKYRAFISVIVNNIRLIDNISLQ